MKLATALAIARGGRLGLLWAVARLFTPFYRLTFAAAAVESGLAARLAAGPQSLDRLAADLAPGDGGRAALAAWLDLGVGLGELAHGPDGYRLRGALLRRLADPASDPVAALVEEVAGFHHRVILETPARLRARRGWDRHEVDAPLIARSSRILEPFVLEAIDWALPRRAVALLEVGCGAGTYLRYAAGRNPGLRALGLELDPEVAAATRAAVARWGLQDRVRIDNLDVRALATDERFDVITLHNVLYYFPVAERGPLLRALAARLVPGGRLIVTTSCRGGSPGMRVLDVWMSSTAGFGPLPTEAELVAYVRDAGLTAIAVKHVIPGEPYLALRADAPPAT